MTIFFIAGDIGVGSAVGTLTGFTLIPDIGFSRSSQVLGKVYALSDLPPTPAQLIAAGLDVQTAFNDANSRVFPDAVDLGAGKLDQLHS